MVFVIVIVIFINDVVVVEVDNDDLPQNPHYGLSKDETESLCKKKQNFGLCFWTTGNTGIPVKTARKKAERERICFSAFISESESKILNFPF